MDQLNSICQAVHLGKDQLNSIIILSNARHYRVYSLAYRKVKQYMKGYAISLMDNLISPIYITGFFFLLMRQLNRAMDMDNLYVLTVGSFNQYNMYITWFAHWLIDKRFITG
jgi:hypothetical protein